MEKKIGHVRITLEQTDLTKLRVDAIVNAANPALRGGGGVDGAIHRAGGPAILEECLRIIAKIGRLAPGRAVMTTGGRLPAKYVIHTVGPIWRGGQGNEARVLASAYRESLELADKMALKSVGLPSIATGAYGYPLEPAAEIALGETVRFAAQAASVEQIIFALFSAEAFEVYQRVLERTA
jgi:O-acetyl-ADP-ribose deacetylase